jgi:hypothetical protein
VKLSSTNQRILSIALSKIDGAGVDLGSYANRGFLLKLLILLFKKHLTESVLQSI